MGYEINGNPTITKLHTVFLKNCQPDFRFKGETHNFWELVCVLDGSIRVAADHRIFTLNRGQAILHNPLQFHNVSANSNGQTSFAVFSFEGENIPPIQNRVCEIPDIAEIFSLVKAAQGFYNFEKQLTVCGPKHNNNSHIIYVKQLELLLLNLEDKLVMHNRYTSQSAKNYETIIKTINENLNKRLSVVQLANICNMSVINMQKTFGKYAGIGIIEYYNHAKITKAKELLLLGFSVKETALKLGFDDQNYFSTVFKRITGQSPTLFITKKLPPIQIKGR